MGWGGGCSGAEEGGGKCRRVSVERGRGRYEARGGADKRETTRGARVECARGRDDGTRRKGALREAFTGAAARARAAHTTAGGAVAGRRDERRAAAEAAGGSDGAAAARARDAARARAFLSPRV
ncbi:hypothetical protein FGB62_22g449 [Gracilaria domingensis]|nr:hypothetical protein FGB62_22g449 [Gracilaria domingensis]